MTLTAIQYFNIAFDTWTAIICLVAGIIIYTNRSLEPKASWTMIGVLLTDSVINISETLGYIFDGRSGDFATAIQHISHFSVYFFICILTMFVATHFGRVIDVRGGNAKKEIIISCAISMVNLVGVVVSRFFGFYYTINEKHHYVKLPTYPVYITLCLLAMVPVFIMVIRGRKVLRRKEFIAFLLFAVLTTTGGVLQLFITKISVYNAANSVSILIVILIHELVYSEDTVRSERMLAMARIHAYESQIQPHFIYNSLAAIRSQLPPDSQAVETLNHFVGFLRGTIDVMNEDECISFTHELKTVKHYLFLEKTRFGDKLNVELDIRNEDFRLPAFTIQLLVENAIRHGIREKPDGRGTVTIATYQTKEAHVIEVSDDGVGFDTACLDDSPSPAELLQQDMAGYDSVLRYGRVGKSAAEQPGSTGQSASMVSGQPGADDTHHSVGLLNLKNRLSLMCGGDLIVESIIGQGTQAWVRIPLSAPDRRR